MRSKIKGAFLWFFSTPLKESDHRRLFQFMLLLSTYWIATAGAALILDLPSQITPNGYYTSIPSTFQWQSVINSDSYEFELRERDSGLILHHETGIVAENLALPGGLNLREHLLYQWRVRAHNLNGGSSDWTPWKGFLVYDPSFVPTLREPYAYISELHPQFNWEPVSGAQSYDLQLFDKTSGNLIYQELGVSQNQTQLPDHILLEYGKVYQWKLRAVDSEGYAGYWSPVRGFLPFDDGLVPTPRQPFSYTDQSRPTFVWDRVDRAESYHFILLERNSGLVVHEQMGVLENQLDLPSDIQLLSDIGYNWQVRALSLDGEYSHWSQIQGFLVRQEGMVPTPLAPWSYIGVKSPTFEWESEGPQRFDFELYERIPDPSGENYYSDSSVYVVEDVEGTQLVLPESLDLKVDTTYRWRVRAHMDQQNSYYWSDYSGFVISEELLNAITNQLPVALGPAGDQAISLMAPLKFTWQSLEKAERYQVLVYNMESKKLLLNREVPATEGPEQILEIRPRDLGLRKNRQYGWQVMAIDQNDLHSKYSEFLTFRLLRSKNRRNWQLTDNKGCSLWDPEPECVVHLKSLWKGSKRSWASLGSKAKRLKKHHRKLKRKAKRKAKKRLKALAHPMKRHSR